MPRLIDADALMEKAERMYDCYSEGHAVVDAKHITSAPTIDPVRRGRWIDFRAHDKDWLRDDGKTVFMECSECHEKLCRNLMLSVNFCPSCGRKMGGGRDA